VLTEQERADLDYKKAVEQILSKKHLTLITLFYYYYNKKEKKTSVCGDRIFQKFTSSHFAYFFM